MSPVYWTDSTDKPRPRAFSFAFEDACTVAVIAGVWLYLLNGWLS